MKIGLARKAAEEWVVRHAGRERSFLGAYYSGSTVGRSDSEELAVGSDIDVVIVTADAEPPLKPGKFVFRDVLVEATCLSWNELASAEDVLANYHLAGSFRTDTIIADPTGRLRQLQARVSARFAEHGWVRRRCENVLRRIEHGFDRLDAAAPLHDQATGWLFPTGVTAHVPLVAALRNPTVRLRYPAARDALTRYGHAALYTDMLELLGAAHLSPQRVEAHVAALERTFDAAAAAAVTPFFFSSDISAAARPIAIDGSRALIRAGDHREAVFWIAATFARCHKILAADAPRLESELQPAFAALLADLGAATAADRQRRAGETLRFLPRLRQAAEAIMAANPDIAAAPGE